MHSGERPGYGYRGEWSGSWCRIDISDDQRKRISTVSAGSSTYPSPNALPTPLVGTSSGTVAAVNGTGSVAIQPLQGQMFGPPNTPVWTNGMNAVATAGASNVIGILE